jgi:putative redox protein
VVAILKKQRQQVTGLEVSAESERDDAPPWRFRRIRVVYHLTGKGLTAHKVQRAIDLAQEKYCSIYATLRDAVVIESAYEIAEA